MVEGVRGRLLSSTFARAVLPTLPGAERPPETVVRVFRTWLERVDALLGPASSLRAVADVAVIPLLRVLGFAVAGRTDHDGWCRLDAEGGTGHSLPVLVLPWGETLDRAWRNAVLEGIALDVRWCYCCNGTALRIVDTHRTWSRHYLEFDLRLLNQDENARTVLWSIARAESICGQAPLIELAVTRSAQHGVVVCRALGAGMLKAVTLLLGATMGRRETTPPARLFEQALTVLYRVLFLLFAEARGLVPVWHPVYRDRYTIDTIVSELLEGRTYRGIWSAIRAISKLAHDGCSVGELTVTAFNSGLFSPTGAAVLERHDIEDAVMGQAVLSLTTTGDAGSNRARIAYRDLDVEQLGAVYEHLLDYLPTATGHPLRLTRTREARKSSGTYYTPRPVAAYLVTRTLDPLVRGRSSDEILRLRVLDPAMGSGAFLVAACRYLAEAAETALVSEGRWHLGDITPGDRATLRREIAQRCLFGVDLNPMAVQLARLSLWLATLAADKPLTFLDHHLVVGDSLVGATPDDVARQPSRSGPRARRHMAVPLFEDDFLLRTLGHAVHTRLTLERRPDESAAVIHEKEATLSALGAPETPLGRWWRVMDLWCAGWFWEQGPPPDPALAAELAAHLLHHTPVLQAHTARPLLRHAETLAEHRRFLHWPLTFPEVFNDQRGIPLDAPGFDAVVGNPPWDMVRGDSGDGDPRLHRQHEARQLTGFVRESGIYSVAPRAHINRYQLFVERALQLARSGGRVGFVLPSGLVTDAGAAPLRRHLFSRAAVDSITGLDNHGKIFPIHRSTRFVLLTCTRGQPTVEVACRFRLTRTEELEMPDRGRGATPPLVVTRRLLARMSGEDDLGIPEMASELDLRIVEKISATVPWLGSAAGWNVSFGRELNATEDRMTFSAFSGGPLTRPVLEGKQVEPFRVRLDRCRYELRGHSANATRVVRRPRLAYREVASATNKLTLIAAVVPARAVTTHTLLCLKTLLPLDAQRAVCALLNSLVANYLVRLRVHTHVTASLVSRLPVPFLQASDPSYRRLALLAQLLAEPGTEVERLPAYAELQGLAGRLYGLEQSEFSHVLSTFPLVDARTRAEAFARFVGFGA